MERDSIAGANEFASAFAASTQEFSEQLLRRFGTAGDTRALASHWRTEACAAVWMATRATLDSSALAPIEREELLRILTRTLVPFWQRHCATGERPGGREQLFSPYRALSRPGNLKLSARLIVAEFLRSAAAGDEPTEQKVDRLADLLAKRMAEDLRRLDEYKRRKNA